MLRGAFTLLIKFSTYLSKKKRSCMGGWWPW
jgi:hypothetical protein